LGPLLEQPAQSWSDNGKAPRVARCTRGGVRIPAVTDTLFENGALLTNVFVINGVGRLMVKRKGMEVSVSSGHQQALSVS
jgi:hypothetical protein